MSCDPEQVTGYVDQALEAAAAAAVEAHIETCPTCREQVELERAIAQGLRSLPPPALPLGFEVRLRAVLRPRRTGVRWAAALAAGVVLALLWRPGGVPVLAQAMAEDHTHCHAVRVLTLPEDENDPEVGPTLRAMPREVAGLPLVSVSVCELEGGSVVIHLQYIEGERRVSVFVADATVPLARAFRGRVGENDVRLLQARKRTVGLVGKRRVVIDAFEKALSS